VDAVAVGGEDEVEAVGVELAGELEADPARSTGHESERHRIRLPG
jgi:hypothetical protein